MNHALIRVYGIVSCAGCGREGLQAADREEVPLLYNLGEGPRYIGSCCYEQFSFKMAMLDYINRANQRTAHERAHKERKHGQGQRPQQRR